MLRGLWMLTTASVGIVVVVVAVAAVAVIAAVNIRAVSCNFVVRPFSFQIFIYDTDNPLGCGARLA